MNGAILDTSVALKWVLDEPSSDRARELREDFRAGRAELIAPDIFLAEVAHALAKSYRRGLILDAETQFADLIDTLPRLVPTPPLVTRALEIAAHHHIAVYDCIYVALAEREGCDLITADDRLVRNLSADFPFLVALDPLPSN